MAEPSAVTSTAVVTTDRPGRYGKQLVAHLSRRAEGEWSDESATGWIDFGGGRAVLASGAGVLNPRVHGAPEELARLEDVVGRHLARFGARDELVVRWVRQDGARAANSATPASERAAGYVEILPATAPAPVPRRSPRDATARKRTRPYRARNQRQGRIGTATSAAPLEVVDRSLSKGCSAGTRPAVGSTGQWSSKSSAAPPADPAPDTTRIAQRSKSGRGSRDPRRPQRRRSVL